jgi:hypothetical protein
MNLAWATNRIKLSAVFLIWLSMVSSAALAADLIEIAEPCFKASDTRNCLRGRIELFARKDQWYWQVYLEKHGSKEQLSAEIKKHKDILYAASGKREKDESRRFLALVANRTDDLQLAFWLIQETQRILVPSDRANRLSIYANFFSTPHLAAAARQTIREYVNLEKTNEIGIQHVLCEYIDGLLSSQDIENWLLLKREFPGRVNECMDYVGRLGLAILEDDLQNASRLVAKSGSNRLRLYEALLRAKRNDLVPEVEDGLLASQGNLCGAVLDRSGLVSLVKSENRSAFARRVATDCMSFLDADLSRYDLFLFQGREIFWSMDPRVYNTVENTINQHDKKVWFIAQILALNGHADQLGLFLSRYSVGTSSLRAASTAVLATTKDAKTFEQVSNYWKNADLNIYNFCSWATQALQFGKHDLLREIISASSQLGPQNCLISLIVTLNDFPERK